MKLLYFSFLFVILIYCASSESLLDEQIEFQRKFDDAWRENKLPLHLIKNKKCLLQMMEYMKGITNKPATWAWKMLDATSKLQPGIAQGNIFELGSFDECLSINEPLDTGEIKGKYCLSTLWFSGGGSMYTETETANKQIEKVLRHFNEPNVVFDLQNENVSRAESGTSKLPMFFSLCVPDACSSEDIASILRPILNNRVGFSLSEKRCQTVESQAKMKPEDWTVAGFFMLLLLLLTLSTAYDVYMKHSNKENISPILQSFSVIENGKSLFKVSKNPEIVHCLNGIRCLSMVWIISGHQYTGMATTPLVNTVDLLNWVKRLSSHFTVGSTVSVDSFFLMSGCLLMYGFLKAKEKGTFFNVPLFYLHRYIRLTPALAVLLLFTLTLNRHMGSGPIWPLFPNSGTQTVCEKYWWSVLLYVQNYVNPNKICLGHTWYLSVEMQLFWIAPLILLSIWKFKRYALHILIVLTLISVAIPFGVAWDNNLWIFGGPPSSDIYYMATHCRAGSWIVGLILGYLLHTYKNKKVVFNKILVVITWLVTLAVMLYIILAGYPVTQENYVYIKWFNVTFIALHRVVWCIGLSWIVFACVHGYGGPVNTFLSLPFFQIIGRLTYCMYLVHFSFILGMASSTKTPQYFSNFNVFFSLASDLVLCTFLAMLLYFSVEVPVAKAFLIGVKNISSLFSKKDTVTNKKTKELA